MFGLATTLQEPQVEAATLAFVLCGNAATAPRRSERRKPKTVKPMRNRAVIDSLIPRLKRLGSFISIFHYLSCKSASIHKPKRILNQTTRLLNPLHFLQP